MASYEIVGIHLKDKESNKERNITDVLLNDGTIEPVDLVARYINSDIPYYFVSRDKIKAVIEDYYPQNKTPYIKTKHNQLLNGQSMLNLPRF